MRKSIIILLTLFTMVSCEDFLDVNQDLDSPETSTPNYLLPAVIANTATSMFDHGDVESYFTQYLTTFSGWHKYKDRWDWVDANRVAMWRRHYHDISINAVHTMNSAKREKATNYEGVARILYAFSTLTTTDVFGDMPYFEALSGHPSAPYDPQEEIYQDLLLQLDAAIDMLENTNVATVRPMTSGEDHLYGGDLTAWIGFAHAVKARALLHLTPNINQNYQDVIDEVDAALVNWKDARFLFFEDGADLLKNQWGPSQADPGWDYGNNILGSSAPTDFFMLNVLGYDEVNKIVTDPRQPLLMTPNADGDYLYIIPGQGKISTLEDEDYPNLFGSYMTMDDSYMPFIVEEELHFIKAEALFQLGQPGAFTSFRTGIETHMSRVGVDAAEVQAFFNGPTIPQDANSLTLSDIMKQKMIALYLQGETWVDMRRHDYSNQIYTGLNKPTNLAYYWDEEDPTEWLERLPYDTETEEIYNKPQLDRLGAYQNPEWLKNPMFWAK